MPAYRESREVPYTPEQMFDLVADIERYPEFVPGYVWARIIDRKENTLLVDQIVGLLGRRLGFHSVATLQRPQRLEVRSTDRPFQQLEIEWWFESLPGGARVDFVMQYELQRSLLAYASGLGMQALGRRIVQAFAERARSMYGHPS